MYTWIYDSAGAALFSRSGLDSGISGIPWSFGCSRTPENEIPDYFLHLDAEKFCIRGFFCFVFVTVKYIIRCSHRLSFGIQTEEVTFLRTCRPLVEAAAAVKNVNISPSFFFILQQFHHRLLFSLVPSVTVAVDHESAARHSRRFPSSPNASRQPH